MTVNVGSDSPNLIDKGTVYEASMNMCVCVCVALQSNTGTYQESIVR